MVQLRSKSGDREYWGVEYYRGFFGKKTICCRYHSPDKAEVKEWIRQRKSLLTQLGIGYCYIHKIEEICL